MNVFQVIARNIIRKSFRLSVWTIEQFYDIVIYEEKASQDGRNAKPIHTWTIEEFAHCRTAALREAVFNYGPAPVQATAFIARAGAYIAIILGTLGMLFCLPFLFSASMADIVGAGFPFIAGAIIASAGLVALSNLARQEKTYAPVEVRSSQATHN